MPTPPVADKSVILGKMAKLGCSLKDARLVHPARRHATCFRWRRTVRFCLAGIRIVGIEFPALCAAHVLRRPDLAPPVMDEPREDARA